MVVKSRRRPHRADDDKPRPKGNSTPHQPNRPRLQRDEPLTKYVQRRAFGVFCIRTPTVPGSTTSITASDSHAGCKLLLSAPPPRCCCAHTNSAKMRSASSCCPLAAACASSPCASAHSSSSAKPTCAMQTRPPDRTRPPHR